MPFAKMSGLIETIESRGMECVDCSGILFSHPRETGFNLYQKTEYMGNIAGVKPC